MIKLKLPHRKVVFLAEVIQHYLSEKTGNKNNDQETKLYVSILSTELLPKLLNKVNKPYPTENSQISMFFHVAAAVYEALIFIEGQRHHRLYDKAVITNMKFEIYSELV